MADAGGPRPDPRDVATTESWLLDVLAGIDGPLGLPLLCPCCVSGRLNTLAPYEDLDVLVEALLRLQRREEVEFRTGAKATTFRRAAVARAVTQRRCPTVRPEPDGDEEADVGITSVGGRAWEREFEPDWDCYVDVRPGPGGGYDLRAVRCEHLTDVLGRLAQVGGSVDTRSVSWIDPRPFTPFEWGGPLVMHRLRFRATFATEEFRLAAIETLCPRWCSPWSLQSRHRGTR